LHSGGDEGINHLEATGALPPDFEWIREDLFRSQEDEGGDSAEVDNVLDIPLEIAPLRCLYRHDHWKFDWGEPSFTRVIPRSAIRSFRLTSADTGRTPSA
jgi:hypothetical protein